MYSRLVKLITTWWLATTCAPRLAISSATEVKAVTSTKYDSAIGTPSFSSARCGGHCGQLQADHSA